MMVGLHGLGNPWVVVRVVFAIRVCLVDACRTQSSKLEDSNNYRCSLPPTRIDWCQIPVPLCGPLRPITLVSIQPTVVATYHAGIRQSLPKV